MQQADNSNPQLKQYVGTKLVNALPMTRLEYNALRGWKVPDNENPNDLGYLVEYPDSSPNTEYYPGYVSWSPKKQFEQAYVESDGGFSFGIALELLRQGVKVARLGWNGKGMFLYYVQQEQFEFKRSKGNIITPETKTQIGYVVHEAHINIVTARGTLATWTASQADVLSLDWVIVD